MQAKDLSSVITKLGNMDIDGVEIDESIINLI